MWAEARAARSAPQCDPQRDILLVLLFAISRALMVFSGAKGINPEPEYSATVAALSNAPAHIATAELAGRDRERNQAFEYVIMEHDFVWPGQSSMRRD